MASLFASPEEEPIHGGDHAAREEARAGPFDDVEVFFNRARRPSSPGYPSPAEYGRAG